METARKESKWRGGVRVGIFVGAIVGAWLARHGHVQLPRSGGELLANLERAGFPPGMALTLLIWVALSIYWEASARSAAPTQSSESRASRVVHLTIVSVGQVLLLFPIPGFLRMRFLPVSTPLIVAGLVVELAAVVTMIWARRTLGRNWSGIVTTKVDHELVRTGPYRRVRHPIYSGMLVLALGTAVVGGEVRGIAGIAILAIAFWRKLRIEERVLGEHFGAAWEEYRKTSWALFPGIL